MSEIHIRHIKGAIEGTYEGQIDLSDWESAGDEARQKAFLSRGLAAYALSELAELDPRVAAASITDGGQDNGIDAISVDLEAHRVVVVQSKWDEDGRGSPSVGDTQKLIQGFRDLITPRWDRFNEKVRALQPELTAALDDANLTFQILLVHTGQAPLSGDVKSILDDLLEEMNDITEVVSLSVLGQAELHALVRGQVEGDAIDLEVQLSDWGHVGEPYAAYYGHVSAEDVARWWAVHGPNLLTKNLRKFITDSEVNGGLMKTLEEEPAKFWYFNNGVTVLCDRIQRKQIGGPDRRSGQFVSEGVSVVNGAQTVGAIGTIGARNPEVLRDAKVLIRFISLEDCPPEFATEVTKATNTQNRIERRDFVALDPEQDRLRTELKLELDKVYAIKTGEVDPKPDLGCSISEATVALACAQKEPVLAVQAKREVGRLWDDPSYRQVFNPSVSALQLWRTVQVLRSVDNTLKELQQALSGRPRSVTIHGNRLIAHLVTRRMDEAVLKDPSADFDSGLTKVPELTKELARGLAELVDQEYESSYLASLFKNGSKCKHLTSLMNGDGKQEVEVRSPERLF